MTTYTRDDALAVQPETSGGKIETTGAYTGHFTLARERVAKTGTRGIEFNFESDDGQSARYLTLWLTRANGERIEYPFGLLSGLMLCLGIKSIDSAAATVDEWNPDTAAREPVDAQVFDALMNQPIGVLLQREEREWEGKTYVSMKIVQFFDPADRSTPAEIQNGKRGGNALDGLIARLRESAVRTAPAASDAPDIASAPPKAHPASVDFDDSDIPF